MLDQLAPEAQDEPGKSGWMGPRSPPCYAQLISAKLYRALCGRDRFHVEVDEHPIQNDWNGSAKVALISLERSEAAWRTIAVATTDGTAMAFADQLRDLRCEAENAFPHAWSFIRPGSMSPTAEQVADRAAPGVSKCMV